MNTQNLNMLKNVLIVIAVLLITTSMVLLIFRDSATNQFGSTPILLTLGSLALVIIVASIRQTLKRRNPIV